MARPHLTIPPMTSKDVLRFWQKVRIRKPQDCWEWAASRNRDGYGKFGIGPLSCCKMFLAHRVAWTITSGVFPVELCVCHACDNPPCCNPAHLFLATMAENGHDRDCKGRHGSRTQPEAMPRGDRNGSRTCPESRPRGEEHSRAKLTDESVRDIRQKYATGGIDQGALARKWKVSPSAVSGVIRRRTWKHVV